MRQGDSQRRPFFRSDSRIFKQNGSWWVATREGDQGPFQSQRLALEEAARYAQWCESWDELQQSRNSEMPLTLVSMEESSLQHGAAEEDLRPEARRSP